MAAAKQGKYPAFHEGAMGAPGRLTADAVVATATCLGLDVGRLRWDMADRVIEAYLDETRRLAEALGIAGMRAFAIGDMLALGAVNGARLRELVTQAENNV